MEKVDQEELEQLMDEVKSVLKNPELSLNKTVENIEKEIAQLTERLEQEKLKPKLTLQEFVELSGHTEEELRETVRQQCESRIKALKRYVERTKKKNPVGMMPTWIPMPPDEEITYDRTPSAPIDQIDLFNRFWSGEKEVSIQMGINTPRLKTEQEIKDAHRIQ
jgi:hypothetical protein